MATFYQQELGVGPEAGSSMIKAEKNGRTYVGSIAPSDGGTAIFIMGKK